MKSLKIFMLAAVAVVAGLFTACSDEEFQAGPEASGAQVYFPESIASEFSIGDEVSEIVIPVMRIVADEAQTVDILAEEESGLFTIPASVAFAAGEKTAALTLTFDRTALEDGVEYPVSLLINDEANVTPYGNRTLAFTVVAWPWELLGTGKFRDDWLTTYWNGNDVEIEVQIHKHKTREGIYMIEEMYGWPFLTEFFGGSQAAIESQAGLFYTPTNITLNASNPDEVFFPRQFSGITDSEAGYGDYEIATVSGGTLKDGVVTFPASGLALFCEKGGVYANKNANFRLMLPGAEITDYALGVEFDSMRVTQDGETSAVLTFTYGADVTAIDYVVAAGSLTAEEKETLAAGIAAGTAENVNEIKNLDKKGTLSEQIALTESGPYTVVAVAYDKAGKALTADFVAINFFFPGAGGGSAPECDIAVELDLPSVLLSPEEAAEYSDESTLFFRVQGSELKSVQYVMAPTAVIESLDATLEEIVDENGYAMNETAITKINTDGFTRSHFSDLTPGTSYTLIIKATNVYGKSKIVTDECSTAEADYKGELVIGDYKMSYTYVKEGSEPKLYENVFTVKAASSESVVDFIVSDFAIEDGGVWAGKYDADAATLTLTSSDLAKWYVLYDAYAYCILAGAGADPVVLTVDADTKQLKALQTNVQIGLGTISGNSVTPVGILSMYYADGTTIEPYAGEPEASASAVKLGRQSVKVPFRSVADMQAVVRQNRLKSNIAVSDCNLSLSMPVRTLDVKPVRCERAPKTVGRVARIADLKENARLMK